MKRRSSYQRTFFDKHGPAGAHVLIAAKYAVCVAGMGALMFFVLGSRLLHLSGPRLLLFTLGGSLTLSIVAAYVGLKLGDIAGIGAARVYMGGQSTPYEDQFSEEQALIMQEKFGAALESFEHRIAATPAEPRVRIAAADLYATHGNNSARAAELYREVQRLPDVASGHDVYVSNKLADLYLGPLQDPGRALVEFRRLAARYPGTAVAKNATLAIANLKPRIVAGADGPPPDVWDPPRLS